VTFTPRTPGDGKYPDTSLSGIRLQLTDPSRYDPIRTALTILTVIRQIHPDRLGIVPRQFDRLAGGPGLRLALEAGVAPAAIEKAWRPQLEAFGNRRREVLLYR
jgi:uncharacterized protein YbbC (DUF1343 family)